MTQQNGEAFEPRPSTAALPHALPKLRFPFVCLLLFWVATAVAARLNKPYFFGFMYGLASTFLVSVLFLSWWWFNRGMRLWEKTLGFFVLIGGAFVAGKYTHHSITYFTLWMAGLPIVASVIVVWLFFGRGYRRVAMRIGFVLFTCLAWASFLVIRAGPANSELQVNYHWRWTPTAEERFLAVAPPTASRVAEGLHATNETSLGDWTEFRGTNRDGIIRGASISTNWSAQPPVLVWKHAVGPSWSSILVVGNKVFTQEQRGERETVVAYDAATGAQVWLHEDDVRFDETVSGPGPRATPTFVKGRLYTLGGTGILNCLESATGKVVWTRDIRQASAAPIPQWAFSSSPLVTEQLVVVYAGGDAGKGLLAYRLTDGELAWSAPAGASSYSSPQLTSLQGVPQVLMLHDGGLISVDPATGTKLWETGSAMKGAPRCGQPRLVESNTLLVGAVGGLGTSLIEVTKSGEKWNATTRWESKDLKPEFPDFVVHSGYVYGFDIGIFCCVNLANGKRGWKEGRYGRGEVMLLPEQDLLLVSSETGELILLAADPSASRELGRFQALQGKTWNHPVVRADRVFIRNAEEIACYSLAPTAGKQKLAGVF